MTKKPGENNPNQEERCDFEFDPSDQDDVQSQAENHDADPELQEASAAVGHDNALESNISVGTQEASSIPSSQNVSEIEPSADYSAHVDSLGELPKQHDEE
ncbi:MAG: hypothetical protein RLZZ59_324 [Pseudomonadota bacterium]|jgi:hypothetical protein